MTEISLNFVFPEEFLKFLVSFGNFWLVSVTHGNLSSYSLESAEGERKAAVDLIDYFEGLSCASIGNGCDEG